MRARHGDPDKFLDSLTRAFHAGDISFDEAERTNLTYRAEWLKAPEHTQVDKPLSEADQRTLDKVVKSSGHSPESVRLALEWLVSGDPPRGGKS